MAKCEKREIKVEPPPVEFVKVVREPGKVPTIMRVER